MEVETENERNVLREGRLALLCRTSPGCSPAIFLCQCLCHPDCSSKVQDEPSGAAVEVVEVKEEQNEKKEDSRGVWLKFLTELGDWKGRGLLGEVKVEFWLDAFAFHSTNRSPLGYYGRIEGGKTQSMKEEKFVRKVVTSIVVVDAPLIKFDDGEETQNKIPILVRTREIYFFPPFWILFMSFLPRSFWLPPLVIHLGRSKGVQ
jgi:hypothetical protein